MIATATRTKGQTGSSTPSQATKAEVLPSEKIVVIHNLRNNMHSISHPSPGKGHALVIQPREYKVLDMEPEEVHLWQRSMNLKKSVDAGIVEVLELDSLDQIPGEPEIPDELQLEDTHDQQTADHILFTPDMSTALEIVNMQPRIRNSAKVDVEYLKDHHVWVLRQAEYREQNAAQPRTWLLEALAKRIKQIERM